MEIQHGIVTKIYPTDCAYQRAIIPDRITAIGNSAGFNLDLKEIELPNSLTEIKGYAFANCGNLETVIIPESVTSIGERAFTNCKSLKRIVLPSGLSKIGDSVFSGCESLEEIVLPDTLEAIPYRTFANCKNLKKVVIPNSIKKIDWGCFINCESLEEIVIPDSVEQLGKQLFLNCKKLKKVKLPSQFSARVINYNMQTKKMDSPTLFNNTLPEETFKGCESLEHIDLPESITHVLKGAFESCEKLKNVPNNITSFSENAFKNCRNLTVATLNPKVTHLPKGTFEGCIKLTTVNASKVSLGEKCFRSCVSLTKVPECVKSYGEYSFDNCVALTSAKNLNGTVPRGTFRGCRSLKSFDGAEAVTKLGSSAFESCKKLETFVCSESISTIQPNTFANCENLTSITLSPHITKIGKSAFNGCKNLKNLRLPSALKSIEGNAFKNCESIENIFIPEYLENIGIGAFSYMKSLNKIDVSSRNKKYLTHDNLCLIDAQTENIIQYAIGCTNVNYSILPYSWHIDELNYEAIRPIRSIGEYAFAGSNYLEELTLNTAVEYLEKTAFENSDKLKTLYIQRLPLFSAQGFRVTNHKMPDYQGGNFPFESVYMFGDIQSIEIDGFSGFKNLKEISLPNQGLLGIRQQAFNNCQHLTKIFIPNSVVQIESDSFAPETLLEFENGLKIKSSDLQRLTKNKDDRLYQLQGYYLVERNGYITKVTKRDIEGAFANYKLVINEPSLVLNYLTLLSILDKDYRFLRNGIFMKVFNDAIASLGFIKPKQLSSSETKLEVFETPFQTVQFLTEQYKAGLCEPIHQIEQTNNSLALAFLNYFDANMKRMIELSGVLNNVDTAVDNMTDLLKLARVLGVFEENPITRQKAMTFINDNIFAIDKESNNNPYIIVGDNIHRRFNELKPRDKFDSEFANFFMKNYKQLCDKENEKTGYICRVYNSFVEIAKTSTSNKGLQRRLLVTFEKCVHYLATHKFNGVTKETEDIALLLGDWFERDSAFQAGVTIANESKTAPRNIFTKFEIDKEDDEIIYDNDPINDLKEPINDDFSFEWLPKQALTNLLLGKYCNCCAHIEGAGAGIMRASMITRNHQNLVIRNNLGEIIAKSTVFVNSKDGYAVFNNIESNSQYTSDKNREKIYNTFMRGAKVFLEKYNENNPFLPISLMTIGTSRNTVKDFFEKNENIHQLSDILEVPKYGNWALNGYGNYVGDANSQQRIVLKIKK